MFLKLLEQEVVFFCNICLMQFSILSYVTLYFGSSQMSLQDKLDASHIFEIDIIEAMQSSIY